jgi:hypothetical protein
VTTKLKSVSFVIVLICCAAGAASWLGVQWWLPSAPQDFEQCSDEAGRTASSRDERSSLIAQCDRQFVGRRKLGGGYTYYDFLQNRQFDIAGPNPTPDELKHFDEQYTLYLDAQRRDEVAAAAAARQSRMEQADSGDDRLAGMISPPPGLPMVIAPANVPLPRARNSVVRREPCQDESLSCSWTRLSAGMKKFFESNAKVDRP